jgi:hypothetical protein
MSHIDEIIKLCREVLAGETFLEESVIREILVEAYEFKSEAN